jgi:hypothetical protein
MVTHFNLASGKSTSCGCHGIPPKPPKIKFIRTVKPKRIPATWVRDSTTGVMAMAGRTLKERFSKKYFIAESGCWIWTSTTTKDKSGNRRAQIRVSGKYVYAARVSYELHKEPVPPTLLVLHKCDNPLCVNPDHLFTGTYQDNTLDAIQKGRFKHLENLAIFNNQRK